MSDIRYYTKESVARQTVYNVEFSSKSDINCNAYRIDKAKFLEQLLAWGKGLNSFITLKELVGEYSFVCEKTGSSWNPKYEWKIYGIELLNSLNMVKPQAIVKPLLLIQEI